MSDNLIGIVTLLINILSIAIIGRALLSWFDPGMRSPVGKILHDITEPIIAPIRQVMPRIGMIDLSPIVAILLLNLLSRVLVRTF